MHRVLRAFLLSSVAKAKKKTPFARTNGSPVITNKLLLWEVSKSWRGGGFLNV
jgi:hypothetical protein